jgi:hypothetical protein
MPTRTEYNDDDESSTGQAPATGQPIDQVLPTAHPPVTPIAHPEELEGRLTRLEQQISGLVEIITAGPRVQAPPVTPTVPVVPAVPAPEPQVPATTVPVTSRSPQVTGLAYSLAPPGAAAISEVVGIRHAYAEQAQLSLFNKPTSYPPYPSTVFVPEDAGLYTKIHSSDLRDGHEAEVMWNTGFNLEMALAAMHKVTESIYDGDLARVTDFSSVLDHFLQNAYLRLQERRDFFTDAAENGKAEAILLQKYLRLGEQPFASPLYTDSKKSFAELRAKAFALELSKSQASSSARSSKPTYSPPTNKGGKGNFRGKAESPK